MNKISTRQIHRICLPFLELNKHFETILRKICTNGEEESNDSVRRGERASQGSKELKIQFFSEEREKENKGESIVAATVASLGQTCWPVGKD